MKTKDLERALDSRPSTSQEAVALLGAALGNRYASVVVKAVRRLGEWQVAGMKSELLAAYARFLVEPVKRDPACRAKTAILRHLRAQGSADHEFFLKALSYRQLEATSDGSEDTAAELRGVAALGLAECGWRDASEYLLPLLVDSEPAARLSGVRALAASGEALVLRLKALQGDEHPEVTGECLESLLEMEGERAVSFVADFLTRSDELCELAALALGGSRRASAFAPLRDALERRLRLRGTILVALATLRDPDADAFLRQLVEQEAPGIEALRPFGLLPEVDDSAPYPSAPSPSPRR